MTDQETVTANANDLLRAGQAMGLDVAGDIAGQLYRTAVLTGSLDEIARTVFMELLTALKSAKTDLVSESPLAFALLYGTPSELATEPQDASCDPDL